jgi:hypothetical protein
VSATIKQIEIARSHLRSAREHLRLVSHYLDGDLRTQIARASLTEAAEALHLTLDEYLASLTLGVTP